MTLAALAFRFSPNGAASQSPGLRGTRYPGLPFNKHFQPQRGCGHSLSVTRAQTATTSLRLFDSSDS